MNSQQELECRREKQEGFGERVAHRDVSTDFVLRNYLSCKLVCVSFLEGNSCEGV